MFAPDEARIHTRQHPKRYQNAGVTCVGELNTAASVLRNAAVIEKVVVNRNVRVIRIVEKETFNLDIVKLVLPKGAVRDLPAVDDVGVELGWIQRILPVKAFSNIKLGICETREPEILCTEVKAGNSTGPNPNQGSRSWSVLFGKKFGSMDEGSKSGLRVCCVLRSTVVTRRPRI